MFQLRFRPSGSTSVSPAALTPGIARTRRQRPRRSTRCAAPASRDGGRDRRASRPRARAESRDRRRARAASCESAGRRRPAARRRARFPRRRARRESTCAPRRRVEPRALSFSASCWIAPLGDAGSAGARPKIKPVTIAASVGERERPPSTWKAIEQRDARKRQAAPATRVPHAASARPSTAPALESTTLSVSICAIRRPRPAPSARRNGDLLLTRGRAREQQVRQVRADDQHHDADGAREHEQRGPQAAADVLRQRVMRGVNVFRSG